MMIIDVEVSDKINIPLDVYHLVPINIISIFYLMSSTDEKKKKLFSGDRESGGYGVRHIHVHRESN